MPSNTKKDLSEALKRLLAKKEFKEITIGDISDVCGVQRQTFYYHFADIHDLVIYTWSNDLIETLGEDVRAKDLEGFSRALLESMKREKMFVMAVYRHYSRTDSTKVLTNLLLPYVHSLIDQRMAQGDIYLESSEIDDIAQAYCYIFVGLLIAWMDNDLKDDPETLLIREKRLFVGTLKHYSDNCKVYK